MTWSACLLAALPQNACTPAQMAAAGASLKLKPLCMPPYNQACKTMFTRYAPTLAQQPGAVLLSTLPHNQANAAVGALQGSFLMALCMRLCSS